MDRFRVIGRDAVRTGRGYEGLVRAGAEAAGVAGGKRDFTGIAMEPRLPEAASRRIMRSCADCGETVTWRRRIRPAVDM